MFAEFEVTEKAGESRMTNWGACSDVKRWICFVALISWGSYAASVPKNTLKLVRTVPHSGYSEGLDYHDGSLWHALPESLLKIDPKDGTVLAKYTPATQYSESLVWFRGFLWNVSFSDNGLYRAVLKNGKLDFARLGHVPEAKAWGITHDGKNLIVTGDYSSKLYFLSPDNGKLLRTVNTSMRDLEDLAWDGVGIWTSSFTQHRGGIFRIDPSTGKSSAVYFLPDPEACPVVDGIAHDGKNLWITGKHCPSIYLVEMPALK